HDEYNLLILCYDNESYANTDIQVSGSSPWGANSTFSPPGKVHRIMNRRWKKNTVPMLAAGHPDVRYVATACGSYGPDFTNKIRRALTIGGPTFIHSIDPCPKGWDYDPKYSHELGMLAVETGIWVQYEIMDGELVLNGPSRAIARGIRPRKPVTDYLQRQGRFAHLTEEDLKFFQDKIDDTWEKWWIPGIVPFGPQDEG
ncbi:MAG: thiamine pyrophosphate-dependent enzyme, partial [Chloroflexi bacterium]|nr:thiamine pyrophosphate-dependent enzyme [Chloroflexota bacterium]